MESDEGKLFVGGLGWETTEEKLRGYFGKYGEIREAMIMRDRVTGLSRGFAFVVFSDPAAIGAILDEESHSIDGRLVDAKKALPREQHSLRSKLPYAAGGDTKPEGDFRTRKIFVGGLPSSLTEDEFGKYFQVYGNVTDKVLMFDQNTRRPRGFGFITFDSEDAVDKVLEENYFHELKDKLVEVKRALPKEVNPGGNGRGAGYWGYGYSGSFRFPPPFYTPYGSLSYGYGYDLYTCYGGAAGLYGNPGLANIGYASSQGYGYGGFFNGATSSWGASANRGGVSASTSRYKGRASGTSQNCNQGTSYIGNGGSLSDSDDNEIDNQHVVNASNGGGSSEVSTQTEQMANSMANSTQTEQMSNSMANSSSEVSTQTAQHMANGLKPTKIYGSSNGSSSSDK